MPKNNIHLKWTENGEVATASAGTLVAVVVGCSWIVYWKDIEKTDIGGIASSFQEAKIKSESAFGLG